MRPPGRNCLCAELNFTSFFLSGPWPGRADVEDCGGGSHRYCKQRRSGHWGEFLILVVFSFLKPPNKRWENILWVDHWHTTWWAGVGLRFTAGCLHPEEECGHTGWLKESKEPGSSHSYRGLYTYIQVHVKMRTGGWDYEVNKRKNCCTGWSQ